MGELSQGINHDITSTAINMNVYSPSLSKSWPFLVLLFTLTKSESSESIVKPLQETDACRYKVWYLEICDPVEKIQVVHLILAEGGTNCEIVRHLTKDCVPGKDNDHPVMPEKAAFKELLLSQNHSQAALDDYIQNSDSNELPTMLKPGSSKLKESEAELLQEMKEFEAQEDKTLNNMEETMKMMTSSEQRSESPSPPRPSIIKNMEQPTEKQSQTTLKSSTTAQTTLPDLNLNIQQGSANNDIQEEAEENENIDENDIANLEKEVNQNTNEREVNQNTNEREVNQNTNKAKEQVEQDEQNEDIKTVELFDHSDHNQQMEQNEPNKQDDHNKPNEQVDHNKPNEQVDHNKPKEQVKIKEQSRQNLHDKQTEQDMKKQLSKQTEESKHVVMNNGPGNLNIHIHEASKESNAIEHEQKEENEHKVENLQQKKTEEIQQKSGGKSKYMGQRQLIVENKEHKKSGSPLWNDNPSWRTIPPSDLTLKTNGKNPGWKDPKWSEKQNKKNPGWKSPEWKNKYPEWKNKSPEWKNKSPEWKNKSPEWKEKSPEWKDTTPGWKKTSPSWKNNKKDKTGQVKAGPNWNWVEKRYRNSKSPEWKNKSPEWKNKSPEWKNKSPEWKSPEWKDTGAEKYDFDKEDLGLAFNLTEALRHEYLAKNGSKIVNWMITNDGKQTIIVL